MKKLLSIAIAIAASFTTIQTAEAGANPGTYAYISGRTPCGQPIYTQRYVAHYDSCGRPVFRTRVVTPSQAAPHRGYRGGYGHHDRHRGYDHHPRGYGHPRGHGQDYRRGPVHFQRPGPPVCR